MDKMLTFEEWEAFAIDLTRRRPQNREVFDKARQGMIPESEAVRIPKEWPRHATGINVVYTWDCIDESVGAPVIAHIPRPTPKWVPQVGEPVFFRSILGIPVQVAIVKDSTIPFRIMGTGGQVFLFQLQDLKPFSATHIGKPWDEIPGGRE